jgi:hypothetical protein
MENSKMFYRNNLYNFFGIESGARSLTRAPLNYCDVSTAEVSSAASFSQPVEVCAIRQESDRSIPIFPSEQWGPEAEASKELLEATATCVVRSGGV